MGGGYGHGFDRADATGQRVKNVPQVAAVSHMLAFVLNSAKPGPSSDPACLARTLFHPAGKIQQQVSKGCLPANQKK